VRWPPGGRARGPPRRGAGLPVAGCGAAPQRHKRRALPGEARAPRWSGASGPPGGARDRKLGSYFLNHAFLPMIHVVIACDLCGCE
jgi:hypothetical protein